MVGLFVRQAVNDDFESILSVYEKAREFMKNTGNPSQWGSTYPTKQMLENDLEKGQLFVVEHLGMVVGSFVFFVGIEPNYAYIENGEWAKNGEYGVLHKVASDGSVKGVFGSVLAFAKSKADYLRIDTHADNKVMQSLLDKNGFTRRGVVYMRDDGTPRFAYDR